jgi:hypothetical protein
LEPPPKRIYLPENSDIRFERDSQTGEAIMIVCGQEFTRKRVPAFSERFIRKQFRVEIEQHKNFVCPTDLEQGKTETEPEQT